MPVQVFPVLQALGHAGEPRLRGPRRVAHDATQAAPFFVREDSDGAPAVRAPTAIHPVRGRGRLLRPVADRLAGGVAVQQVEQPGANEAGNGLELRQVDELALAGASAVPQRGQHGQRAAVAAGHVGVGIAPAGGLTSGVAHLERVAGQGLQGRPVAHVILVRAGVAETGHGDGDDVGFELLEAGVVQSPIAHDARAEIVDHHVGHRGEPFGEVDPTRVGHVDDRALLAAVEVAAEPAPPRAQVQRVAPLDLDDLCALVGQNARRHRPGHHPGEIEDAHALQCPPPVWLLRHAVSSTPPARPPLWVGPGPRRVWRAGTAARRPRRPSGPRRSPRGRRRSEWDTYRRAAS